MLQIGIFTRMGYPCGGLISRSEGPSIVLRKAQRLCMVSGRLTGRNVRMARGAGFRTSEILRQKEKCGQDYQVNRPLY